MAAGELHTLLETEESQPLAERGPPRDRPWVALESVEADVDVDPASPGSAEALRDLRARRDVRVVLCLRYLVA